MTPIKTLTCTAAMALIASPALADLSPDEVWSDWQSLIESYGASVSIGSEETSSGNLTVTGVEITSDMPEAGTSIGVAIGEIVFTDNGDGSVGVSMSDAIPMIIGVSDDEGAEGQVTMTLRQPDASLTVSGSRDDLRYLFNYPVLAITDLAMSGPEIPADLPLVFNMSLTNMAGTLDFAAGDPRTYNNTSSISALTLDMSFADPDSGNGSGEISMSMLDLNQITRGTITPIGPSGTITEMIGSGFEQASSGTYGPLTYNVRFEGPDGSFEMAAAAEGGSIETEFGPNGVDYGGTTENLTITVGGSQLPLPPVTARMAESSGRFQMPLVPSEETQNFALQLGLIDLEVDDVVWSLFDPTGALPRDPATLVIDLEGSGKLTQDISDPAAMQNGPPGELEAVSVNALRLKVAGAELTGDGAFEFDNTMGIPMPVGVANLMLTGGNGLLDKLVMMGLLPQDQAMGARMMLGLFARPGEGEDSLVSTIEMKEDGSVLANGQRIR